MERLHLPHDLHTVGHFLTRLVSFCPLEADDYMSTHYHEHPLDAPVEPVTRLPNQYYAPLQARIDELLKQNIADGYMSEAQASEVMLEWGVKWLPSQYQDG